MSIECRQQEMLLHHERCAYWVEKRTLLVADTHFGKEHAFGRAGMPIPAGCSEGDIGRLSALVTAFNPARLLILGDLIHSTPSRSEQWLDLISAFIDHHSSIRIDVVAGNHDRPGGRDRLDPRISWHTSALREPPFVLQHEPASHDAGYVICGHIHPAYRFSVSRNNSLRAPVFWQARDYLVLPSFGEFTGGHNVRPDSADKLFLAGPDCVLSVPVVQRTPRGSMA